ncbi:MAG TPA: T9SS type A sorting domain-containing protein, partial [Bacteroidia bacterium]
TYIKDQFNLVKPVTIGLAVDPPGAGTIQISTIVPDSLPWSGIYFDGVPVTMTVNANAGYKFQYWKCNSAFTGENDSISITRDVHADDTFTAYFRSLELNFSVSPNPFGNSVTFTYELPEDAQASLKIYNVLGQKVAEVITPDQFTKAGSYSITLNPDQYTLASGVYFAEFKAGDYSKVIKIVRARE